MMSGASRGSGGKGITKHLTNADQNEAVRINAPRGLAADDLRDQVRELVAEPPTVAPIDPSITSS